MAVLQCMHIVHFIFKMIMIMLTHFDQKIKRDLQCCMIFIFQINALLLKIIQTILKKYIRVS